MLHYLVLEGYLAGPHGNAVPNRPLRADASVIDILGAVFPVVAAPAALREREITGKGQRVSSAPFESTAFLMSTHMAGMTATGLEARPMPVRRGAWAVYKVFKRCRWPAVHQRHQRPAMDAVCRGIPAAGIGRRSVSWAPVGQSGDLFTDPHLLATAGWSMRSFPALAAATASSPACRPCGSSSAPTGNAPA